MIPKEVHEDNGHSCVRPAHVDGSDGVAGSGEGVELDLLLWNVCGLLEEVQAVGAHAHGARRNNHNAVPLGVHDGYRFTQARQTRQIHRVGVLADQAGGAHL